MITITIQGKDGTKQITNSSNVILTDNKGKPMSVDKQCEKITEIAMTIGGQNYKSHKFEVM